MAAGGLWGGDRFLARHQHAACRGQQTAAARFSFVYHHVVAVEEHKMMTLNVSPVLVNQSSRNVLLLYSKVHYNWFETPRSLSMFKVFVFVVALQLSFSSFIVCLCFVSEPTALTDIAQTGQCFTILHVLMILQLKYKLINISVFLLAQI